MTCPLCGQRKGKRACPAKQALICSACCGAKRRIEIDCPQDCVYLGEHAAGWEGRESERRRDMLRIAPFAQALDETQAQMFFLALVGVTAIRSRHAMDDALLHQALGALRKTLETRSRGVLYDHAPEDPRAVALVEEIRGLFTSQDEQGRPVAADDKDVLAVMSALETAVESARGEQAGGTAFLDSAARVAARFAKPREAAAARPLIVTP